LSTLALIQTALERGAQWPAELEEEQLRERHSTALTKVERRKMGGGGGEQKLGTEQRATSGVAQQSSEAAARSRAVSMKTGETKKSR
jgi:hypothetical protein